MFSQSAEHDRNGSSIPPPPSPTLPLPGLFNCTLQQQYRAVRSTWYLHLSLRGTSISAWSDVVKSGSMWAPSFSVAKDRHVASPPKSCCFTKCDGSGPPDLERAEDTGAKDEKGGFGLSHESFSLCTA